MEILDFIEKEQLQQIQDLFSTTTGIAVCIIDREGNHITRDSNVKDFCKKYNKGSELGRKRCLLLSCWPVGFRSGYCGGWRENWSNFGGTGIARGA